MAIGGSWETHSVCSLNPGNGGFRWIIPEQAIALVGDQERDAEIRTSRQLIVRPALDLCCRWSRYPSWF